MSKQVQDLIKKETTNNYSAAQNFNAIRSVGTEAGTSLLDTAGVEFTPSFKNSPSI